MKKVVNDFELDILFYSFNSMNSAQIVRNFYDDIEQDQVNKLKQDSIEFENLSSLFFDKQYKSFLKKYNVDSELIDLIIINCDNVENFKKNFCIEYDFIIE